MMLYTNEKKLSDQVFANPGSAYRGAPFWAWNCKPDPALLKKELDVLKEMGMGGAHIHSRVGLDIPYLGQEFMNDVKSCEEYMKSKGMQCCLYDEDRWPSGSCGGMVTKDHRFRQRYLVFKPCDLEERQQEGFVSAAAAVRSTEYTELGIYEVNQDEEGYLTSYRRLPADYDWKNSAHPEKFWSARLEVSGDTPWFNDQAYVDTLNKKAIDRFIELTHEKYYDELKDDFGTEVKSIFTDEPQMSLKEVLETPFERKAVILPFTDDFDDTFREQYGFSILDHLPELVLEPAPDAKTDEQGRYRARYLYHRHLVERFSGAYGDNVGKWCEDHGIALTGHMMNEWTLYSQTAAVGEAMRPMKNFTIPGIDMLCDRREFSTAKQSESVSHQMGREGAMSEIYGVTGWPFDFRGHKLAGDWQAALGVTFRVPHLSWVSMAGEGKRDYPASIGYQSPWYREYHFIEDHFARLNTVLTRGTPHVDVAVIHPIESYWMFWGNRQQTTPARQRLEQYFTDVINWLLFGLIDFDFISESMLAEEEQEQAGDRFVMGRMRYRAVVVPGCVTLRRSTFERLRKFAKAGGRVIFLGKPADDIDCVPTDEVRRFAAEEAETIENTGEALLNALSAYRVVDTAVTMADHVPAQVAQKETGSRARNMFYQMRDDNDAKWLFLCHVNKPENPDVVFTDRLTVRIRGQYAVTLYDTMTGKIAKIPAEYRAGDTFLTAYTGAYDSLLLRLEPAAEAALEQQNDEEKTVAGDGLSWPLAYSGRRMDGVLPEPFGFRLDEDNVLLLDLAEYAFDDENWQPEEELLRIDNLFREKLGFPLRMEALAQPWTHPEQEEITHTLHLRFRIDSEADVTEASLAMEELEKARVSLNGEDIPADGTDGYYVDASIKKTPAVLKLKKGRNLLQIDLPFGRKTNVEWCYLLGRFGVTVRGREKTLASFPEKLVYGDYTRQSLPFYAGNLTYEIPFHADHAGRLTVESPQYRGALQKISVDDGAEQLCTFAPYRIDLGEIVKGDHVIHIRVFGNRHNAFGPVHNADLSEEWYGPNIWRTDGNKWCYEYRLMEMGLLTAPMFRLK
ncbi:MAG: glycosyl hydrolase [Bilifractor sp.]|jgi:hypothetical protein